MLWAREVIATDQGDLFTVAGIAGQVRPARARRQRQGSVNNPTKGAVTVSEPTDRQTPKRAGGAAVTNPPKVWNACWEWELGTAPGQIPHCVESCETLFLKAARRGFHASGSHQERRAAIIFAASGGPRLASAIIA